MAITGLNAADNPAPGVAVARCLRLAGFRGRMIGLTFDHLFTGCYAADLFTDVWLVPPPAQGTWAFEQALARICRDTPITVLLPTLDAEVFLCAALRGRLEKLGIRCLLPPESALRRCAKPGLPDLAAQFAFGSPRTALLDSHAALGKAIDDLGLPLFLKGALAEARLVHSALEAEREFDRLTAEWGFPLIAQERVVGAELNLAILCDSRRRLVGAVLQRKLGITPRGKGWAGITVHSPELLERAAALLAGVRWVGAAELEMIVSPKNGVTYLIEINPRFPAWIYLAAEAGQNLPWWAVCMAQGMTVRPTPTYRMGQAFIRTVEDYVVPYGKALELKEAGRTRLAPA